MTQRIREQLLHRAETYQPEILIKEFHRSSPDIIFEGED